MALFVCVFIILLLTVFIVSVRCTIPHPLNVSHWKVIEPTLRSGDLLFYSGQDSRMNMHLKFMAVRAFGWSEWNHVGMVIRINNIPCVFHLSLEKGWLQHKFQKGHVGLNTFRHEAQVFQGYLGLRRKRKPYDDDILLKVIRQFSLRSPGMIAYIEKYIKGKIYKPLSLDTNTLSCTELVLIILTLMGDPVFPVYLPCPGFLTKAYSDIYESEIIHTIIENCSSSYVSGLF